MRPWCWSLAKTARTRSLPLHAAILRRYCSRPSSARHAVRLWPRKLCNALYRCGNETSFVDDKDGNCESDADQIWCARQGALLCVLGGRVPPRAVRRSGCAFDRGYLNEAFSRLQLKIGPWVCFPMSQTFVIATLVERVLSMTKAPRRGLGSGQAQGAKTW